MDWLIALFREDSVTHAVLILSLVSALGLMLGSLKLKGVGLGVAGVLFTGLLFGHYQISVNAHVLEFVREFGLILFVYTIGVQVGPGFASSLKKNGLPLNLLAAAIVFLGLVITALLCLTGKIEMPVAVGLFSGAVTNTPSLGAAQQALKEIPNLSPEVAKLPGLGYAVAYPFGILGIILTMGLVRIFFRVKLTDEISAFQKSFQEGAGKGLATMNIEVRNPNLEAFAIKNIPGLRESGVVISRILHEGKIQVAQSDTTLSVGDILLAVGRPENLEMIRVTVGAVAMTDLREHSSEITAHRMVVTRKEIVGRTPKQLDLFNRYGVTLTRVIRADIEFTPTSDFELQFADRVVAVGTEDALKKAEQEFGNTLKTLDHPQMIPILLGIALGVVIGSIPFFLPGAPAPVKLGLAGGPLIVAILLSRLGHFRSLIWYMPASANFMLRELGILLFLACVGLKAGDRFVSTLVEGDGVLWMAYAAMITLIPLLIVGFVARAMMRLNYMTLCGLLAGSMTDPPALAFANTMAASDAPSISYATVYPLTMLLRVVGAQILVLLLA